MIFLLDIFGKYLYLISRRDLDEKIGITLTSVSKVVSFSREVISLA